MITSENNLITVSDLDQFVPELPIEIEKRYCVGYYDIADNRQIIVVFDKLEHRVVYKGNSRNKKDKPGHKEHHEHIFHFYGKSNCEWRSKINPQFYEGL